MRMNPRPRCSMQLKRSVRFVMNWQVSANNECLPKSRLKKYKHGTVGPHYYRRGKTPYYESLAEHLTNGLHPSVELTASGRNVIVQH